VVAPVVAQADGGVVRRVSGVENVHRLCRTQKGLTLERPNGAMREVCRMKDEGCYRIGSFRSTGQQAYRCSPNSEQRQRVQRRMFECANNDCPQL
jgi:hypothetical protein